MHQLDFQRTHLPRLRSSTPSGSRKASAQTFVMKSKQDFQGFENKASATIGLLSYPIHFQLPVVPVVLAFQHTTPNHCLAAEGLGMPKFSREHEVGKTTRWTDSASRCCDKLFTEDWTTSEPHVHQAAISLTQAPNCSLLCLVAVCQKNAASRCITFVKLAPRRADGYMNRQTSERNSQIKKHVKPDM